MTNSEFLHEIETIIEADLGSISMDNQLASLAGWDSLAIISLIAMADAKLGVVLNTTSLASCMTVGDLAGLFEGKIV